jgi:hypothetical protein
VKRAAASRSSPTKCSDWPNARRAPHAESKRWSRRFRPTPTKRSRRWNRRPRKSWPARAWPKDAGLALGEIEKVSNDLADLIQNISSAARQQSAAATNISATMNVIQEITTQTSVGASQTAESIGNLAQLAADLRRSVADFKLPS